MAVQSKLKAPRRPSPAGRGRGGRALSVAVDDELRTGSSAPAEPSPRALEVGIGAQVRRLRKALDLTVAELGTAAEISAGMLSKIENGAISPSLATLDALAKALTVPRSRLFPGTEERRDRSLGKARGGARGGPRRTT